MGKSRKRRGNLFELMLVPLVFLPMAAGIVYTAHSKLGFGWQVGLIALSIPVGVALWLVIGTAIVYFSRPDPPE